MKDLQCSGKYVKENRALNLVRWEIHHADLRQREFVRSLLEIREITKDHLPATVICCVKMGLPEAQDTKGLPGEVWSSRHA